MAQIDLRPLTVGEILDRTFTLYRRHFLLFIGISAVPQLVVLAFRLANLAFAKGALSDSGIATTGGPVMTLISILIVLIGFLGTLFSQGATIFAVSDFYLGRAVSVAACLRRAWSEVGTVFAVGVLNGLIVLAGTLALVLPGLYVLCRLCIATPAALIEQRGAQESLSRSWNLTKNNAGRAFLLLLLYFVISMAAGLLLSIPFAVGVVNAKNNPVVIQFWTSIVDIGSAIFNIAIIPILLIATCLFYFDLRVRKEAFDLQFMLDPASERTTPPGSGSVPSIL